MNNTTLILILAVGGIAVYAITRKPAVSTDTVVIKERKLSGWEKAGGIVGDVKDWVSSRVSG